MEVVPNRQGVTGFKGHHFCLLKARGDMLSVETLVRNSKGYEQEECH